MWPASSPARLLEPSLLGPLISAPGYGTTPAISGRSQSTSYRAATRTFRGECRRGPTKARTLTHSLTLSAASRLPSSKNCRSRSFTLSDYPTNTCVGDQTEMPRLDKWGWPLRSVYPQTGILTVPSMPDVLRSYPRLGWTFRRGLLPAGSAYAVRTRTDQDQRTKEIWGGGLFRLASPRWSKAVPPCSLTAPSICRRE